MAAQLLIAQLADSAFPSGAFAHSYGLEQSVCDGRIASPTDLVDFTYSVLCLAVAGSDAVVAASAARAAALGAIDPIIAVDHKLYAMKAATELRLASTATGRRVLDEVGVHGGSPIVQEFAGQVVGGLSPGTHAAAFGAVAGGQRAEPQMVAAMLMQATAAGMLQAALRLMRVSHRDVQAALHDLRPRIVQLAALAATPDRPLGAFHPAQEIAAMRHRNADLRLFAS